MKTFLAILSAGLLALPAHAAVVVAGGQTARGSDVIVGFNPAPTPAQNNVETAVVTPVASGIGTGFGFNGVPVGFIMMVDTNFVAVFTNQFGTNLVALPFAGTDLGPFAGRVPLGNLAPPTPLAAPTNSAPGPAPAVPPQIPAVPSQTPTVGSPPPSLTPIIPQPGTPTPPAVAPTGRPPFPSAAPVIPPGGVPTPSPTPIPPQSTPVPPSSTPVPR
jgi:hypothetical protein